MTERYYDCMDEHQGALTPFFANVRDRIEEYRRGTIAA